jgi:mono/diheme cytochrome c family protein
VTRLFVIALVTLPAAYAQSTADAAVRILAENCLACHGQARMSGLDLRTREGMLSGGKRGPAVVPGKASESLLYKAIAQEGDLRMPPGKQSLDQAKLALVREWIDAGAQTPNTARPTDEPAWWSFKRPVRPTAQSIDELIRPETPEADRRTLIRRATLDLTGLPPTPKEVDDFLADSDSNAYQKLIDRLLASPRYGERWGRLWLDVVRYADTGGYETDVLFPNAWRYRDYVIKSFNEDKPYDVFIKEQIAADEIWPDNLDLEGSYDLPESKRLNLERRIGTSLYTLGALPVENTFFGDQYRAEWQGDSVDVTGAAFLGLTLHCARCHDHKFDPISQRDYYRLSAIFAGSEDREVPIVSQMRVFEFTRFQTKHWIVEDLRKKYNRLKPDDKDGKETLLRAIGEAYVKAPVMYDKANVLVHTAPVPDTHVLVRGEWKQKGDRVKPGFPAVFGSSAEISEPETPWFIPRRRAALADWIASREHPLTARVLVNRLWQGHFGRGIVSTPNDFGRQGERPSKPELLDWLAAEFMESKWSMKHMHRLIMNSAVYKARRAPARLEAEAIRDSILSVSGALNDKMYGPPVVMPLAEDEREAMRDLSMWPVTSDASDHDRRSVYLFVKRSFRLPMLATFDAPDTSQSCPRRDSSTVAPQALTLMNSEWMHKQAERFAARISKSDDPVGAAWRVALSRTPQDAERAKAEQFLARNSNSLQQLALLVFNMSEFLYVD